MPVHAFKDTGPYTPMRPAPVADKETTAEARMSVAMNIRVHVAVNMGVALFYFPRRLLFSLLCPPGMDAA
jgi:hypothetical protein